MRIAFISGVESSGGAARAAIRLHDALARLPGVELRHFTGRADRPGSGAVCFTQPGRLRGLATTLGLPSGAGRAARRNLLRLVREFHPDAISLHNLNPWTAVGFGREIVPELAAIAPVAWRMPDMWPVSGCCSYVAFCERGGHDCRWTAQHQQPPAPVAAPAQAEREALAQLGPRLALVSPSRWLADIARAHFGGRLRAEVIASGLDLSFWRTVDRSAARAALELPVETPLALFIADHVELPLKGASILLDALRRLPRPCRLVIAGKTRGQARVEWPLDAIHLGALADDRLLRLAYSAANLVVLPSLAENLPGVALEALACGTPCAGLPVGGIPEVVVEGQSGALASDVSAPALADAMTRALSGSFPCRAFASAHFESAQQAAAHLRLLRELASL